MRFPRLAHRSAAAHKLHSTPQQDRMNLISGKGETTSRLPAFSLFLPGSCPNYRDRRRGRAAIQVAFTIFVLTETWLVPVEGWLVDRFGPKIVVFVGGVLVAIAWMMNSAADTLTTLYIAAALGGIGAGGVYGTCIGNALKWFPDR